MIRSLTAAGAVLLLLGGCGSPSTEKVDPDVGGRLEIVHVRNCDYVLWANGYHGGMAHAGDCHNPIHQCPPCP